LFTSHLSRKPPTHSSISLPPQYSIFSSTNNGAKKPNKNTQEKKWITKKNPNKNTWIHICNLGLGKEKQQGYVFVIWV
jgi:hypothetical protein